MIIPILLLHAVVLFVLEFFLYPELLIYPYLITKGFLPYKDILDQHFPGLMFFPVNFYSLGFTDPISFKFLLILVVCLQSILVYKIAKHLGNRTVGILASLGYLLWQPFFEGNQLWLDIFLPLFTLPAFWFFLKRKWFLCGLFLGLGIVFKQTQVPLVACTGLLILYNVKKSFMAPLSRFCLGALLPSGLMLLYLGKIGVWHDFWYWAVTFNLSEFATGGSLAPRLVDVIKLMVPVGVLVLAVWKVKAEHHMRLVALWLGFTLVGGMARFGLLHIQPAVPYFSLAWGFLVYALWQQKQKLLLFGVIGLTMLWIGYFYSRQSNFFHTKFFDVHTNQILTDIENRTEPNDKIFLLGVQPHLYVLSQTTPPDHTYIFQFPWFFNVAGDRVLSSIINDPPKIVVYDDDSNIDGQYMRDYGKFLLDYVRDNYSLSLKRGTIEIYESRH